jgi:hypothetical protein
MQGQLFAVVNQGVESLMVIKPGMPFSMELDTSSSFSCALLGSGMCYGVV